MQSFSHNLLLLIKRKSISMKVDVDIDGCKQGERELSEIYTRHIPTDYCGYASTM